MRITTRIALALILLIGVMAIVLAHQVRMVNDLQRINEEMALNDLEAARISIRLVQQVEGVREFASKTVVTGDDELAEQWELWEEAALRDLDRLRAFELGPPEREAVQEVEARWAAYLREVAPLRTAAEDNPAQPGGEGLTVLLDRIDEILEGVRAGVEEVIEAQNAQVAAQARHSYAAGERARQVAWMSALGTGVLGLLICGLLYLSISGPLRRLTRGTREISEGRFEHRIPVSGRDELSQLAHDFNEMATRLDELEEMKRDFVSHVSHELKGPLAAIHETILVLMERIPGPINEKQAQLLALSRQSATRLSGMISNLLQVSRIESGALALEPEWVDLQPLLRDVRDELTPLATERNLEIEVDGPPEGEPSVTVADPDRLREVVGNLLENAIKFSPRGEAISLRTRMSNGLPVGIPPRHRAALEEEAPPFLLLTVEDRGPGIPEEHREGIFEKFYQVKRGSRVHGQGVGLGLAICRNLIESHGGAIWVENQEAGGARFHVVLPRTPRAFRKVPGGTMELRGDGEGTSMGPVEVPGAGIDRRASPDEGAGPMQPAASRAPRGHAWTAAGPGAHREPGRDHDQENR